MFDRAADAAFLLLMSCSYYQRFTLEYSLRPMLNQGGRPDSNIKDVGLNGFAVAGCGTVAGCADPGYDFEGRELISASSLEERIA
jgi:hypothetical protein